MNDYCRKKRLGVSKIMLNGLDHIGIQTKKYGIKAFAKEVFDVINTKRRLIGMRWNWSHQPLNKFRGLSCGNRTRKE